MVLAFVQPKLSRGRSMNSCKLLTLFLFSIAGLVLNAASAADKTYADYIYTNAKIWTGDSTTPSASSLAIKGNKILAVGEYSQLRKIINQKTKVIDLRGARVTPGFIDNHTHFADVSGLLSAVQLRDAPSQHEFVKRIANFTKTLSKEQWILMGIWDHEAWGGQLPEAKWIDDVTPNNPLFLLRTDGHMALANSKAMSLAGVDKNTPEVPGGEIVRDDNGNPTGVFRDAAMLLISKVIPELSIQQQANEFKQGVKHALSYGVTQIHDMGQWQHLHAFKKLAQNQQLDMRVYSFVPLQTHAQLAKFVKENGRGNQMHRWGGLKGLVDGSLGSTTAWFYQAYNDEPDKKGFPIDDLNDFSSWIKQGDAAGLHVTIHAIGDKANDWLLDQFLKVEKENPNNFQRRWRIEHAQHLSQSAINRIAEHSIIASMQPFHAIDDGRWAEKRIGKERIKTTYAFDSLLDKGAIVTFGSDAPVAPMNVMHGIYAAVTRRTIDNKNPDGWVPEQKINVEEALTAYTKNNAYAGFQEDKLGQLKAGYLADFVVLEKDILSIPAEEIKDVRIKMTIVDGKVVYRAKQED